MRTSKTLSVSLPPDLLKEMEQVAKEENRTMSELIREAWRRYKVSRHLDAVNAYGRDQAATLGITETDVVRLTREVRKELAAGNNIKQPVR